MKKLITLLSLVLILTILSGCGPTTERTARRREQRNQTIRRNWESIAQDNEVFWLTDKPLRLSRWDPPSPHD